MSELRFSKDGVPIYDGAPELYVAYQRAALTYAETVEWKKRSLVGPRLQAALEGSARMAVEHMAPGWISHDQGASQLLRYLKQQDRPWQRREEPWPSSSMVSSVVVVKG